MLRDFIIIFTVSIVPILPEGLCGLICGAVSISDWKEQRGIK
jgi:hypothetical protein